MDTHLLQLLLFRWEGTLFWDFLSLLDLPLIYWLMGINGN